MQVLSEIHFAIVFSVFFSANIAAFLTDAVTPYLQAAFGEHRGGGGGGVPIEEINIFIFLIQIK
jgi:hypothetical protein